MAIIKVFINWKLLQCLILCDASFFDCSIELGFRKQVQSQEHGFQYSKRVSLGQCLASRGWLINLSRMNDSEKLGYITQQKNVDHWKR